MSPKLHYLTDESQEIPNIPQGTPTEPEAASTLLDRSPAESQEEQLNPPGRAPGPPESWDRPSLLDSVE